MPQLPFKNVISVDVEDYFQAESFAEIVDRSRWNTYTSRVDANTRRLLELFDERGVQASFFIVGWVAERFPQLIRDIAAAGHELGCHSYWHRLIYKLTAEDFREDTHRAKSTIEQIAGTQVLGYRAPTYSIVSQSLWALAILVELGFSYDSSIFPTKHDRYGMPRAPRSPFRVITSSGSLIEFPITTFRVRGHNMPVAGGGYLRILPEWYTKWGIRSVCREGLPIICYVHPWEIDPAQPRLPGRLTSRLRHYTNLSKTYGRLDKMLRSAPFTSFRDSGLAAIAKDFNLYAHLGYQN
ncbi:MAG: DUF3473 domain-containing protein [Acidobacteria bacterium]|nr:DUF3473 domain-containing protein [Acidobacteriota bacterium]